MTIAEKLEKVVSDLKEIYCEYKLTREIESDSGVYYSLKEGIDMHRYKGMKRALAECIAHPGSELDLGSISVLGAGKQYRHLETIVNSQVESARMILFAKPGVETKYLRLMDGSGNEYFASLSGHGNHYQIRDTLMEALGKELIPLGGGRIMYDSKEVKIYGKSVDYGKAVHSALAGFLQKQGIVARVVDEK